VAPFRLGQDGLDKEGVIFVSVVRRDNVGANACHDVNLDPLVVPAHDVRTRVHFIGPADEPATAEAAAVHGEMIFHRLWEQAAANDQRLEQRR